MGPKGGPDVGVGGTREQGDYTDSFRAKFFAERVGEAVGGVLGGVVGSGSGEDAGGGDGEIVDDGASALHDGERGLSDEENAVEICFENIFPDGEWKFFDREIGVGDAGVVDEDVEAAEFAARSAEEGVDGVRVADIAGVSEDFDFGGEFPAEFLKRGFVAGGDDQVASFGSEGASDG